MMKDKIMARLDEMCTEILFSYKGRQCGIDPLSRTRYDMWYGETDCTVDSIEKVMNERLFDGKCLNEIADDIENVDGL